MKTVVRWLPILPLLAALMAGCSTPRKSETLMSRSTKKIKLRMDEIRPDGLRGPPNGLVSVAYEFCVPADPRIFDEVRRLDPSAHIHPGSRGRIGCSKKQALCIGSTHQPHWRQVLDSLAAMPYITEIRECFFE